MAYSRCLIMKNKPRIRFKGFTEDWEQRKLKSIANMIVAGGDIDKNKVKESGAYPVIANALTKDGIVGYYDDSYRIEAPAVTVTGRGDIGVAKARHQNFTPVVRLLSLTTAHDVDFIEHAINNLKIVSESTGVPQLTVPQLSNYKIHITSIIEERKIGLFISKLDNLITLHQRKLEKLKLAKKALLQKLFPKNGSQFPEIRFKGFTDAWEQRKLNEFLSVSNLKNTENKYNKKDVLSVSGEYGIVNQIDFQGRSFAGASVSNYGVVEKGDIVYTKSPLKLNPYGIIKTNRINNGIVSTLYAVYKTKENCDSKFIEHYFNLDSRLNQYLKPLVNKGAKNDMKVSSENALIGEVCFPQITEQALIVNLLDYLDIYITLHQRKLDKLQDVKKGLLQKMFV